MSYTVADVDRVMNEGVVLMPSEYGEDSYDFSNDDAWLLVKYQEIDNFPTELGVISHEKSFGGEGRGDQYWVVVKIEGHDGSTRYFRKDGWYQSYSGGELDGDTYEVKPKQVMRTEYV